MTDTARDAVLGRLRRSLGRTGEVGAARATVEARLGEPRANLIPARADLPLDERIALFQAQAEAVQTVVERIPRPDGLPEVIAGWLRRHDLPLHVLMADEPWLKEIQWDRAMVQVEAGRAARETDAVGLTTALAGIAETGTLMLLSDRAHPTTIAFLPDNAVVVLHSARVLRAYEDALALVREAGALPRSINFITGPSRTADIEQTLQLGAHGPRRLLAVLIDEAPARESA